MLPLGSALRTFEIYFAPGDGSRPSQGADVRPLYFSEKAMEVVPGVTYTIRVVEVTLLPGARRDLTPRELQINYVLEGVMTRRVGDQVLRYESSSVLKLPIEEASAKIRTGFPIDDEEDYTMNVWAGLLPVSLATAEPIDDERLTGNIRVPDYVTTYSRKSNK